jgi:hypothetical protein
MLNIFWGRRFGAAGVGAWPKILGGHAGAPKIDLLAPLSATLLGAPVEML